MGLWGVFPSLLSLPLVAANHTVGELATQLVVSIAANGIGNRMAPREVPRKGPVSIFPRAIRHETTLSSFMNRSSRDRKSTRLNSSHVEISYAVFCLKKKK